MLFNHGSAIFPHLWAARKNPYISGNSPKGELKTGSAHLQILSLQQAPLRDAAWF